MYVCNMQVYVYVGSVHVYAYVYVDVDVDATVKVCMYVYICGMQDISVARIQEGQNTGTSHHSNEKYSAEDQEGLADMIQGQVHEEEPNPRKSRDISSYNVLAGSGTGTPGFCAMWVHEHQTLRNLLRQATGRKDTEFFVMQSFPKFTLIQPPTKTARQMEGEGNASRAVKPTGTHMSRLSASMRSLVIFLGYVVLRSCKQS